LLAARIKKAEEEFAAGKKESRQGQPDADPATGELIEFLLYE
jgi:hypothetical protein